MSIQYYTDEQFESMKSVVRANHSSNFDANPLMLVGKTEANRPNTGRQVYEIKRMVFYNNSMAAAFSTEPAAGPGTVFTMFDKDDEAWLNAIFVNRPCNPSPAWNELRYRKSVWATRFPHCCGMTEIFGANECFTYQDIEIENRIPIGRFILCVAAITSRAYNYPTWHTIIYAASSINPIQLGVGFANLSEKFGNFMNVVRVPLAPNGNTGNMLCTAMVRFTREPTISEWQQIEAIHMKRDGRLL